MNAQHILVPLGMIAGIIITVIAILNYSLKSKILKSGYQQEEYIKLLKSAFEYRSSALKWGLIMLFGGIGLVIINYIPNYEEGPLPYGIEAIMLAAGFITYYIVSRKEA